MQKWRILLKEQDAQFLDDKVARMKIWLAAFWRTKGLVVEGVL
jgi:hypothetical protein